ncbi:MAG: NADH-quinone oxidoreductase subunit NuoF [Planctomycetes bacterium]|nr:NADH-quinone oxidoreductase subunit NuoF [Planctomycetota bacterium]
MSIRETRILLSDIEHPESPTLDFYLSGGGYKALEKALKEMTPKQVVDEVTKAKVRGRGGAGFEAGRKWQFLPKNNTKPVYLTCNADESEPGTFKDRHIMERRPHLLIEGCLITCYAIGAKTGYIYVRGEFPQAQASLSSAVEEARAKNLLGPDILGTGVSIDIWVHTGAGAYICGEETGMLSSIEGGRGHPKLKPPFPAVEGLFRCPTVVNNVETLSNVPFVIREGADAFLKLGTADTPGTRIFCVSGHVEKPGVFEYECGVNLKDVIAAAGGVWKGRKLKAVIPGGASAHVLLPHEIDVACDFGSLAKAGTIMGSCGVVVIDDTTCMVETLQNVLEFFAHESCGQCTPCREGTGWARKIVTRIEAGKGTMADIDRLYEVADNFEGMGGKTICALSDAAAWPTKSYVKKFRQEFEEHVRLGRCPMKGA